MSRLRDRHARGFRGQIARPNAYTGSPVPVSAGQSRSEFFAVCVQDALAQVSDHCPRALASMDVGVEDVPSAFPVWAPQRVPLASAASATPTVNGQVVLYRRPLERRARTRPGLRILVFRTLVEQLSEATGIPTDEIDPLGHRGTDED